MLPALSVAMFLIFLGTGPLNAAIINAVPAAVRSTAIAFELLIIHAIGDTPSPKIIGMVSDHSNLATGLGVTPHHYAHRVGPPLPRCANRKACPSGSSLRNFRRVKPVPHGGETIEKCNLFS